MMGAYNNEYLSALVAMSELVDAGVPASDILRIAAIIESTVPFKNTYEVIARDGTSLGSYDRFTAQFLRLEQADALLREQLRDKYSGLDAIDIVNTVKTGGYVANQDVIAIAASPEWVEKPGQEPKLRTPYLGKALETYLNGARELSREMDAGLADRPQVGTKPFMGDIRKKGWEVKGFIKGEYTIHAWPMSEAHYRARSEACTLDGNPATLSPDMPPDERRFQAGLEAKLQQAANKRGGKIDIPSLMRPVPGVENYQELVHNSHLMTDHAATLYWGAKEVAMAVIMVLEQAIREEFTGNSLKAGHLNAAAQRADITAMPLMALVNELSHASLGGQAHADYEAYRAYRAAPDSLPLPSYGCVVGLSGEQREIRQAVYENLLYSKHTAGIDIEESPLAAALIACGGFELIERLLPQVRELLPDPPPPTKKAETANDFDALKARMKEELSIPLANGVSLWDKLKLLMERSLANAWDKDYAPSVNRQMVDVASEQQRAHTVATREIF